MTEIILADGISYSTRELQQMRLLEHCMTESVPSNKSCTDTSIAIADE